MNSIIHIKAASLSNCIIKRRFGKGYDPRINPFDTQSTDKKGKVVKSNESKLVDKLEGFYNAYRKVAKMKVKFSPEEMQKHQEIAKTYTRERFRAHNKFSKDLSNKIYLKKEAINNLPPALRVHASKPDKSMPPPGRQLPIWDTPPVENFDPTPFLGASGSKGMPY